MQFTQLPPPPPSSLTYHSCGCTCCAAVSLRHLSCSTAPACGARPLLSAATAGSSGYHSRIQTPHHPDALKHNLETTQSTAGPLDPLGVWYEGVQMSTKFFYDSIIKRAIDNTTQLIGPSSRSVQSRITQSDRDYVWSLELNINQNQWTCSGLKKNSKYRCCH